MDRIRQVSPTGGVFRTTGAAGLIAAALGAGCLHVHTDADGKVKAVEMRMSEPGGGGKPAAADQPGGDGAVKQAVATIPAAAPALAIPSFAKLTGKGETTKGMATELALAWHNRVTYLPDPSKNGAMGAGLVGQMFLFGPGLQFAPANGKLSVEMFDDTTPGGRRLGGWTFDKDTMRKLITMDERFGKSYALFLPWPDYKPEVTRVRLSARYDPESGYPLFSSPSTVTFDTTPVTGGPATDPLNPPLSSFGLPAAGGGPAVGYTVPPGAPGLNAVPIPVGGGPATSAGVPVPAGAVPVAPAGPPGGLPPIAFTLPAQR
ncbi:MAG: hypothetical protein JWO38_1498 [Gemmataceae bacterium]|nr:hypothetical protein [Gemmataceae bacterium]